MTDYKVSQPNSEKGYHGRDTESEVSSTTDVVEKRKLDVSNHEAVGTSDNVVKRPKLSFGIIKPTSTSSDNANMKKAAPISIKLGSQKPKEVAQPLPKASATVAKVFNTDDDEEEEMPPEAKMRMRNLGRETPTSAGPNSFGKTKRGFCDTRKVFDNKVNPLKK